MQDIIKEQVEQFKEGHRASRRFISLFLALAMIVGLLVSWRLKLTGVAMTSAPTCGVEEHTHTDACYSRVLVCGQEETPADPAATGETAQAGHLHTDACYETRLTCGKTEHTHTAACYADTNADLETESDWSATLPTLAGTGWGADVAAVAQSQLGYTQSENNYQVADDGTTLNHYTRYGAWYGNPYGGWNGMFAAFCLHYANVPEEYFPEAAGAFAWSAALAEKGLYAAPADHTAAVGDLVFLGTTNKDGTTTAEKAAIVTATATDENGDTTLTILEGDVDGSVRERTLGAADGSIVGYGDVGAAQASYEKENGPLTAASTTPAEKPTAAPATQQTQQNTAATPETAAQAGSLAYTGGDYTVTLRYGADAAIPAGAALAVREYAPGSDEYNACYEKAVAALAAKKATTETAQPSVTSARFFDITILVNGEEFEPAAPVAVKIDYAEAVAQPATGADADYNVVHLADDKTEVLATEVSKTEAGVDGFAYQADSFSTYGLMVLEAGAQLTASASDYANLTSYLTGVTVDTLVGDANHNAQYDKETDSFSTTAVLAFTLPAEKVAAMKAIDTAANRSLSYTLPTNFLMPDSAVGVSKAVTDSDGNTAYNWTLRKNEDGTYWIEIAFAKSYLESTSAAIKSKLRLEGSAGVNTQQSDGSIKITFKDGLDLTISGDKIAYPPDETSKYQISTKKTGSYKLDADAHKLYYTVTIDTTKGTPSPITLADVLTTNGITITASSGKIVSVKKTKTQGDDGTAADTDTVVAMSDYNASFTTVDGKQKLSLTLNKGLKKGEQYTVVYEYSFGNLTTNLSKTDQANTVTVSSTDSVTNQTVTATGSAKIPLEYSSIKKSGTYQADRTILWTITVNSGSIKQNIANLPLTDVAFAGASKLSVKNAGTSAEAVDGTDYTISVDGTKTITFLGLDGTGKNYNSYTITYVTPSGDTMGNTVKNTAYFNGGSATGTVGVSGGRVTKAGKVLSVDRETEKGIVEWTVTIDVPNGGILSGTVLEDELWDRTLNQSYGTFTLVQAQAVTTMLQEKFGLTDAQMTEAVKFGVMYKDTRFKLSELNDNAKIDKWWLTLPKKVDGPQTIQLVFQSTADISGLTTDTRNFVNHMMVGNVDSNHVTVSIPATVKKGIIYGTNFVQGTTTGTVTNASDAFYWGVQVLCGSGAAANRGTFTVTDTLPAGVALEEVTFGITRTQSDLATKNNVISSTGAITYVTPSNGLSASNYSAKARGDGTTLVTLTIDAAAYPASSGHFFVTYKCRLTDEMYDGTTTGSVVTEKNTVKVTQNGKLFGKADSTIKITVNKPVTPTEKVVEKTGKQNPANKKKIDYSIKLNPSAKNLDVSKDTLELEDTLKYYYLEGSADAFVYYALDVNSVLLYEMNEDGTKGTQVGGDRWSFTASAVDDGYGHCQKIITATVPDQKALILEYSYVIHCDKESSEKYYADVTNTATLTGASKDDSQTTTKVYWAKWAGDGEVSTARTYSFTKVDADNWNTILPGATFTLYKYDSGTSQYTKTDTTYTTDTDGKFVITDDTEETTHKLDKNTAYYVEETKAPGGYLLPENPVRYYFQISNSDTVTYPPCRPNSFSPTVDLSKRAEVQTVTNYRSVVYLSAGKMWQNSDGGDLAPADTPASLTLTIMRHTFTDKAAWQAIPGNNAAMVVVNIVKDGAALLQQTYHAKEDSTFALTLVSNNNDHDQPPQNILINGEPASWIKVAAKQYKLEFTAKGYTEITGELGSAGNQWWYSGNAANWKKDYTPIISTGVVKITPAASDVQIATLTLKPNADAAKNWRQAYPFALPRTGVDGNGKTLYYGYYVTEPDIDGFELVTSVGNVGTDGVLDYTLTNKADATYNLPKTGGAGTTPFTAGGLALMAGCLLAGYTLKRKKERGQNR